MTRIAHTVPTSLYGNAASSGAATTRLMFYAQVVPDQQWQTQLTGPNGDILVLVAMQYSLRRSASTKTGPVSCVIDLTGRRLLVRGRHWRRRRRQANKTLEKDRRSDLTDARNHFVLYHLVWRHRCCGCNHRPRCVLPEFDEWSVGGRLPARQAMLGSSLSEPSPTLNHYMSLRRICRSCHLSAPTAKRSETFFY